jgi:flagellar M-ring protein FliF
VAEKAELTKTLEESATAASGPFAGLLGRLRAQLRALPPARRTGLFATAGFLVLVCALMGWYAERPDWRVLFSGLDAKDVQQVSQQLATAGIAYQIATDGASIEVPADALDKARMEVAAKGMPQTGRLGFELFDKPNWMGSEFDERVNYQRALEGELEQTISTLAVVRSARVHLVLPAQSLFTSEVRGAKASVVLKLRHASVDPAEADAMRSLVAGAVENLAPEDVVLVDADGRANLKPRSKNASEGELEQALELKLVSLLEPLAGRDNVRATVNLSYDQGSEERTDEIFDPTQVATVNMQRSEQSSAPAAKASGVPGTASNTPAASPNGAVQGSAAATPGSPPLVAKEGTPVYPQASLSGQTIKEESGTYAVTKHTVHSELEAGRLRRITAAIVVNDRTFMEGEGRQRHAVWKPRTADEMHRMEELAEAAIGYDLKRGDQVVLENLSFSGNVQAAPPTFLERAMEQIRDLLETQPGLLRTLTMGVCGLLIVLLVLRPVARQLTTTLSEPLLLKSGQPVGANLTEGTPTWTDNLEAGVSEAEASASWRRGRSSAQVIFDSVSEHIRREPVQSTRLLESWIGAPEDPGGSEVSRTLGHAGNDE